MDGDKVEQKPNQIKRNFASVENWDTVRRMKIKIKWILGAVIWLFISSAWARTWQTPIMATWTEDPRTTVTLAWERHGEGMADVEYGELNGEPMGGLKQEELSRRHVFTLRGLRPGTKYAYTATSSDGYKATGRF